MKKRNLVAMATLALAISFVSCKNDKKTETETPAVEQSTETKKEVVDEHTSQNSLDWSGTYQGVVPCADCPGIDTTIVLNEDGTFTRVLVYQDKADGKFEDKGTFAWDAAGSVITLKVDDKEETKYQVREGALAQLDQEGKAIEGELAEKYLLAKK
ncbi:copper resistance protein NlpE [Myroides sp. BIT-d1]|uniref:Copper resistance protein NlpE n=1 Tax=Myroides albus TaxID=2562892 RepID=A0A6I3LLA3_9FLAO|nr:copper resistance protein NlpE [Myroides albus]MTG98624.1 copper resistance protein NlpE [Myroides albus]